MQNDRSPVGFDLAYVQRRAQEVGGAANQQPSGPGGARDGAPAEPRKPRFRRVLIDDGDAGKPAELLATQFPARRPNRRRSPRLTPPARPDRRTP